MTFIKNKFKHGNEIFFVSIMVLLFAPHDYKLTGLGILCFTLLTAAVIDAAIDWKKNTKRVRRITRRVRQTHHEADPSDASPGGSHPAAA